MLVHAFLASGVSATTPSSPITLSGTLNANSTSGTVTSATVTVTVPGGNSGVMTFSNYIDVGTVTNTQYSRNGGAFTTVADGGSTVAFSNGDTLAVRTASVGSGESRTIDVYDATVSTIIETVLQYYG